MPHALRTLWPPPAAAAASLGLERCSRLLHHDQDTGGFFIALLRKRRPLAPSDGGGVLTMFNSFSGAGYSWNRQLFDATFVSWESSLEKLVTNEPRRTNSVTMVFERPVAPSPAPAAPPAAAE